MVIGPGVLDVIASVTKKVKQVHNLLPPPHALAGTSTNTVWDRDDLLDSAWDAHFAPSSIQLGPSPEKLASVRDQSHHF